MSFSSVGSMVFSSSIVQSLERILAIDGKTIDLAGSICLIANNITGPAMVGLGTAYAQAGYVPATALILLCGALSLLSSGFLCETIYSSRGNRGFARRMEVTDAVKESGASRPLFLSIFWAFVLLFISQNVAAIVESAQTFDELLVYYAGKSCCLELWPQIGASYCVEKLDDDSDSPFGNGHWVVSLGFVSTFSAVVPLSFLNLSENILVQKLSFLGQGVIVGEWILVQFLFVSGLSRGSPPAFGSDLATSASVLSNLFGPVLFNYTFVLTLPSWLNEKRPGVRVKGPVVAALAFSTAAFIALGWTAASAEYDAFATTNDDVTSVLVDSPHSVPATKLAAFLFPPVVLWGSIPVFAIVVRGNLLAEKVCGRAAANLVAGVLPWALALTLYSGTLLDTLTTWSGLLLVLPLNFVLPCALFLAQRETRSKLHGGANSTAAPLQWENPRRRQGFSEASRSFSEASVSEATDLDGGDGERGGGGAEVWSENALCFKEQGGEEGHHLQEQEEEEEEPALRGCAAAAAAAVAPASLLTTPLLSNEDGEGARGGCDGGCGCDGGSCGCGGPNESPLQLAGVEPAPFDEMPLYSSTFPPPGDSAPLSAPTERESQVVTPRSSHASSISSVASARHPNQHPPPPRGAGGGGGGGRRGLAQARRFHEAGRESDGLEGSRRASSLYRSTLPPFAVNWAPLDPDRDGPCLAITIIVLSVILNAIAIVFST